MKEKQIEWLFWKSIGSNIELRMREKKKRLLMPNHMLVSYTHHLGRMGPLRWFQLYHRRFFFVIAINCMHRLKTTERMTRYIHHPILIFNKYFIFNKIPNCLLFNLIIAKKKKNKIKIWKSYWMLVKKILFLKII